MIFAAPAAKVSAQTTSLSVAPAILETIVKPGDENTATVEISNQTNIPLPIKGYVRNFIPTESVTSEDTSAFKASDWFTLEPGDFILQPHEKRVIEVVIAAPKDTEPGGHYATIYFEPLVPKGAVSAESTLSLARIGVLVFMVAPGDIQERLTVKSLKLPDYLAVGPTTLSIEVENTGNLHLVPSGKVWITDMFGRRVTELKTDLNTILPSTSRSLTVTWDKRITIGKFTFEGEIMYGSEQTKISLEKKTVLILPWHLLSLVLVPLTIIMYIVIVGRRRFYLAWQVLQGKADAWQRDQATKVDLRTIQKEKDNVTKKSINKQKTLRAGSRHHP